MMNGLGAAFLGLLVMVLLISVRSGAEFTTNNWETEVQGITVEGSGIVLSSSGGSREDIRDRLKKFIKHGEGAQAIYQKDGVSYVEATQTQLVLIPLR